MGESINCNICGAHATVHLTQILNSKIQKVDLCEKCAHAKGVMDPEGFALGNLLGFKEPKIKRAVKQNPGPICLSCGLTAQEFKDKGRVGCGNCYEGLGEIIHPALKDIQAGLTHRGKVPGAQPTRITSLQRNIKELEGSLALAIQEERFEDAALCRDNLQAIREQMQALHLPEEMKIKSKS